MLQPGTRVWVSGQAVAGDGDLARATRLTLEGLDRTLRHLKLKDDSIVQLKVFLQPMDKVDVVRHEISLFYGPASILPPVVFVEWKLPGPIEIELIANGDRDRGGWPVEYLATPELKASPVFSRVARVNYGPLIYVSGLHPRQAAAPADEVSDVFTQLGKVLDDAGSDFRHLVKATYFATDDATVKAMRELRPRWYDPQRPPAASLATVAGTGRAGRHVTLDMIAVPAPQRNLNDYGPPGHGHGLSEADARAGWISLFDGQTTFGWRGGTTARGRLLRGTTTSAFGDCEVRVTATAPGELRWGDKVLSVSGDLTTQLQGAPAAFRVQRGLEITKLLVRPTDLKSLLNGKDLAGWKRIDRDTIPEAERPRWAVEDGVLRSVGGPGALEYQDEMFGDFVLQAEVRSRLRYSNGGIFFRAIPGDFMNGYEAQIYTRCVGGDVDQPATWATGAIDDRQNARRLMSRDGVPFTMTVLAQGPHVATWVNGHQTVDWTDTRAAHVNARQGKRLEPGVLQLQAHDVATDQEFRSIRARKW